MTTDTLLGIASLVGPVIDAAIDAAIGPKDKPRRRRNPHLRAVVYVCDDRRSEEVEGEMVDEAAFARRRRLRRLAAS